MSPSPLLALSRFAQWHNDHMTYQDPLFGRMRASAAYLGARRLVAGLRRTLRRFLALWRRRCQSSENEQP